MADKEELALVFQDTEAWYQSEEDLKQAIQTSIDNTAFYAERDLPTLPAARYETTIVTVNEHRSLESAFYYRRKFPEARIGIHNFASATNPGGGVRHGSRAQEEALCRCMTLLPVLETEENNRRYYQFHKNRRDFTYTDACIYTPDIVAIKSDTDIPQRLPKSDWQKFDVLTCAAPNLRLSSNITSSMGRRFSTHITDKSLREIHIRRATHLLTVAAHHGIDILILGAFGCGAFHNNPEAVASAYKAVLADFQGHFQEVAFAVFCTPEEKTNYEVFSKVLG
ncbi:MAG: TIGR02452 family protein [Selenomonadaceae bacterium]|nr:TIGR02452 family protein [Selenomonadaceae bacterium]